MANFDNDSATRFGMFIGAAAEADSLRLKAHMVDQHGDTPTADGIDSRLKSYYSGTPMPYQPVWPTAQEYRDALDKG
jgi:hypothetical protein